MGGWLPLTTPGTLAEVDVQGQPLAHTRVCSARARFLARCGGHHSISSMGKLHLKVR